MFEKVLTFLVLGLGEGALISAVGLGVVLTFRGSGVVNFATGAMAMYASYVYSDLRVNGDLFLPPLPGVPTKIHFGGPLSFWPATMVSLLVAAVMGVAFHLLIFRPLRHAPVLAKVVASIGLMLTLQAIVVHRFTGNVAPDVNEILPSTSFHLFGAVVPWDRIVLAVIVVVAAAALWAVYRFTRFGLATQAAAENEKGAVLLGFPTDLLAGANWVLGSVLAALIGILVRGIIPLEPNLLTLLIVPALAAALTGGFASFGITVAAGLAIGMLRSLVVFLETLSWWPKSGGTPIPGVGEALPFVVIALVMVVRGRSLPTRGAVDAGRLPFVPRPIHLARGTAIWGVACAVALLTLDFGWRGAIINSLTGTLLVLSFVVITGWVGQISLAQLALAGVAGFTVSKLAHDHGVPFPLAPLLAALVAAGVGVVAALPALRVRGVNLAVVTLAAAVTLEEMGFKNTAISGGSAGALVPSPSLFGVRFGPTNHFLFGSDKIPTAGFGLALLLIVVLMCVLVANLRRGATGRRLLAVRSNERAAAGVGIDVGRTKLLAFGLAAFVAGIGGALIGYKIQALSADSYDVFASFSLLAAAYLGGITSVNGAVVGGLLTTGGVSFYFLQRYVGVGPEFQFLIGGL
ncbi:MAG: ABC transporter permease, partial [Streptomyces sp.]|uniref:ABC transporter permease n=1 Tax=Streptomyces sp. TaxID=1931 RepID=UPI0025D0175E